MRKSIIRSSYHPFELSKRKCQVQISIIKFKRYLTYYMTISFLSFLNCVFLFPLITSAACSCFCPALPVLKHWFLPEEICSCCCRCLFLLFCHPLFFFFLSSFIYHVSLSHPTSFFIVELFFLLFKYLFSFSFIVLSQLFLFHLKQSIHCNSLPITNILFLLFYLISDWFL